MSAWLQTKSWEEAKEAIVKSKGVAIVPIGSVEQHSYHLPLGTDTYVAMTIAEEAAEKTGAVLTARLVRLEPASYGASRNRHHPTRSTV